MSEPLNVAAAYSVIADAPSAASSMTDEAEEPPRGLITFKVANEEFGAELTHVREILNVDLATVTPLYRVEPFLVGVMNLRGQIKPVINLGLFLGILGAAAKRRPASHDRTPAIEPAVVVVSNDKELICLVDRIDKVTWVPAASLREISSIVNEKLRRFVSTTVKTEGKPISILNSNELVNAQEWKRYQP